MSLFAPIHLRVGNTSWNVQREFAFRLKLKYFINNSEYPEWVLNAIESYADQLAARYERLYNVTRN